MGKSNLLVNEGLTEACENHSCSVCFEIFLEPVTTSCGHSFCKGCLEKHERYLEVRDRKPFCPLCRSVYSHFEVNHSISRYLRKTKIVCLNHLKYGCKWKGYLSCLKHHLRNCEIYKGKKIKRKIKKNIVKKSIQLQPVIKSGGTGSASGYKEMMRALRRRRDIEYIDLEEEEEKIYEVVDLL